MERGRDAGMEADGHRRYIEMAVAHVLGGLDQSEGRVFRAHLLECGECRARVGELRAIAHELADVERDERRVRAVQAIETKSREADAGDVGEEPRRPRGRSWALAILGLVMLLGLGSWTVTLRQNISSLERQLDARVTASSVLELGTEWPVTQAQPGVEGAAKTRDGQLALLVEGLDSNRVYGLYLLPEDGRDPLYRGAVRAEDGRVFPTPLTLAPGADRIVLTLADEPPGPQPEGLTVFEAVARD